MHRQKFRILSQSPGESITCFVAGLRTQDALCEFCITCPSETCATSVSYTEDMIAGQMIAGLANVDHQAKILAEAKTLTTLKDKYDRLASLETTDQSTLHLHMAPPRPMPPLMPSKSTAQKSQYTRQKWSQRENKTPTPAKDLEEPPTPEQIHGTKRLPSMQQHLPQLWYRRPPRTCMETAKRSRQTSRVHLQSHAV